MTKNQENVDIDVTPPVQALIGEDVDTAGMVTKFQENVDIDVTPPAQALIGEDVDTAGKVTKNQENVDVTPPAQALIGEILPELNAWKKRKHVDIDVALPAQPLIVLRDTLYKQLNMLQYCSFFGFKQQLRK